MSNHPNRSRRTDAPGKNPKPREIAQLREEMELTQTEFGALVYRSMRIVQDWEGGQRRCPPDTWQILCLIAADRRTEKLWRAWPDIGAELLAR